MTVIEQPDFPPVTWSWGPAEVRRYALAVGAPVDVMDRDDLDLVREHDPRALGTFATLLADAHSLRSVALPGLAYDPLDVLYAGHTLELPGPLPSTASGTSRSRILEIGDVRSGVLVRRETTSHDESGRMVARNVVTSVIRGASVGSPFAAPEPSSLPNGEPTEVRVPTLESQAVLYAQTGDQNPLHLDPDAARAVGFDRPILHGLCALGMVVHRVARDLAGRRWGAIRGVDVRFVAPVVPGEELIVSAVRAGDTVHFETRVGDRRVHANGRLDLAPDLGG